MCVRSCCLASFHVCVVHCPAKISCHLLKSSRNLQFPQKCISNEKTCSHCQCEFSVAHHETKNKNCIKASKYFVFLENVFAECWATGFLSLATPPSSDNSAGESTSSLSKTWQNYCACRTWHNHRHPTHTNTQSISLCIYSLMHLMTLTEPPPQKNEMFHLKGLFS